MNGVDFLMSVWFFSLSPNTMKYRASALLFNYCLATRYCIVIAEGWVLTLKSFKLQFTLYLVHLLALRHMELLARRGIFQFKTRLMGHVTSLHCHHVINVMG